jgi:hypothetical protein
VASCPSCGAETRQGDWTCRACGSPLGTPALETSGSGEPAYDQAYYEAPTIYGTAAPSNQRPAAAKARGSALPWLLTLAVVAVVAVVAVWFFVLRPSPGAQFLGTWQARTVTASGTTTETLTIARNGTAYTVGGAVGGEQVSRCSASLRGGHLECFYAAPSAEALQYKTIHVVLTVDSGALTMVVQATTTSGATVPFGETARFIKSD